MILLFVGAFAGVFFYVLCVKDETDENERGGDE